jgi:hypothetical protein
MTDLPRIRERMAVHGSCGGLVGTVDAVEGHLIKLTRDGPNAAGQHHYIPVQWVASVGDVIHLSKTCDEVLHTWETEPVEASN